MIDQLFVPLSDFLVNDDPDFDELSRYIALRGLPTREERPLNNLDFRRGFVLEAYVKWALERFAKEGGLLHPTHFRTGEFRYKYRYAIDKWGNATFYDWDGRKVAEIDALWEFTSSPAVPVMFEVTFYEGRGNKPRAKEMVKELYDTPPFSCKIRTRKGDEQLGLHTGQDANYRKIIVPDHNEFYHLAEMLLRH